MTDTTPTREEMIKKIYEVIADKTLSFGCKVHYLMDRGKREGYHIVGTDLPNCGFHGGLCEDGRWRFDESGESRPAYQVETDEIIGHPVMIGDILDWIEKNIDSKTHDIEKDFKTLSIIHTILLKYEDKRKPIDDQDEDCITFINSLLPNEQR